jgi:hypothetical protein
MPSLDYGLFFCRGASSGYEAQSQIVRCRMRDLRN